MLGTGHAMVTKCYNTCFVLDSDNGAIMVDAGGGNGILAQMEKAGMEWTRIKALFITHAHTDHIIGCIWVLRKINSLITCGKYDHIFKVYGCNDNLNYLKDSCHFLLCEPLSDQIQFVPICGGSHVTECGTLLEVFDIHSTKKEQLGFKAFLKDHDQVRSMVCLGDEPCHAANEHYVKDADWLLSEAFCLHSEKERFHPYEKHHSTAYDVGKTADRLGVKNLLLYHTEDSDLENRAAKYAEEARLHFSGNIFVPDDLDVIRMI